MSTMVGYLSNVGCHVSTMMSTKVELCEHYGGLSEQCGVPCEHHDEHQGGAM